MNREPFTRLNLPVPPDFERALGYPGNARHVAFYWAPTGDELMTTDGQVSATGEYAPWLLWVRHISVVPTLFGFDFGNSDAPAKHWLLLDRKERRFYAGGADPMARFFSELPEAVAARRAWEALSAEEQKRIQTSAWQQLQEALEHLPEVKREDVTRRLREVRLQCRKLALWLDQQPVTCPACGHTAPAGAWSQGHSCPNCGESYWIALADRHD